MKFLGIGALMLLVILAASCSSNSTEVAVVISTTVSGASSDSVTLLENTSAQFIATVTGASATTAYWQICKPTNPPSTTIAPTDCTQGVGPTQCTIPKVSSPLTGLGTISATGLYTAPTSPPQPDSFLILATSCVKSTAFGTFTVIIDTGIRVHITPASVSLGTGEQFQFIISVTGTANQAVSLSICTAGANGSLTCGVTDGGTVSPSGFYQAPGAPATITLQAVSSADPNQSTTATISVVADIAPALTAITPSIIAQGSAQEDVYLTGTNFLSTTSVSVGGVVVPTQNVVFLSSTLLRVTIPGAQLQQAGTIELDVQDQEGNPPGTIDFTVETVRPGLAGTTPESVPQNSGSSPNVTVAGGFYASTTTVNGDLVGTTATFNGQPVSATVTSSRQLNLAIPTGQLGTPGLYPIIVQNSGLLLGNPVTYVAGANLGVTPTPGTINTAAVTSVGVGAGPAAVAIDEADGIAVVANTGGGSVSLVALPADTLITTIPVGNQPTGVAVDDQLSDPIALVVNSADQTVSTIDLTTRAVVGAALPVSIGPIATSPVPFAIGVNPLTHRAVVVYQSTNEATVLDVSTGAPVVVQQVTGVLNTTTIGTGASPGVAIDPRLNWAVIAPGGAGSVSLIDLGYNPSAGQPTGRAPQVVGSITITSTTQGVGVNTETHEAFLSDPQLGTLATFSLLDFTINPVFNGATEFDQKGFGAAAVSSLENVGIAVGSSSTAEIVDLERNVVLQTVTGLGSSPAAQAVAVDAVTNQAVVVNQGGSSVSIVSLGATLNPLQIVEASPAIVFGGTAAANAQLTIIGSGFVAGNSEVLFDGVPLASGGGCTVNVVSSREIEACVPGSMLIVPRRYTVQVENAGNHVSNVTDLAVVQAVPVGHAPVGVAVDTDRDLAVVTNSTDGTVSLVALSTQTPIGQFQTPIGTIGLVPGGPITVGTTPSGVAVLPRAGLALVANTGSNDATVVDVTQTKSPASVTLCGADCTAPTGVAMDQDTGTGAVTNTNPGDPTSTGTVSFVDITSSAPASVTSPDIDHNPVAVAIDENPLYPYAAVATDSSDSTVDFLDTTNGDEIVNRAANLEGPTGIVFDPVNQIFLAADSLADEVVLIDPTSFLETPVRVGIGPTSLDYNYQDSTLVTVNSPSHTMSVLSYVCPPTSGAPSCVGPVVQTVIGLGGTQAVAPIYGPSAVAIDPILNLAVLVDEDNNQVLLIPLPH